MRNGGAIFIRHGLLIVPFVVLIILAIAGEIGAGYGFPNLFRDHPGEFPGVLPNRTLPGDWLNIWMTSGTQVAFSATILFGLVWVLALLTTAREEEPGNTHPVFRARHAVWPAVFVLALFAVVAQQLAVWRSLRESYYTNSEMLTYHAVELIASMVGVLAGLLFVYAIVLITLWIAYKQRIAQIKVALLIGTLVTLAFTLSPTLMPGFAFFNVLGVFSILYMAFAVFEPKTRLALTVAIVVWSVFCGTVPLKHNYADLKRYYELPRAIWPKLETSEGCIKGNRRQVSASHLVTPLEYLGQWHAAATKKNPGKKPVFVVVAASGGAYRATYWTALVLDKLMAKIDTPRGFKHSIGLLTGASGGMVASAYFAAMSADGEFESQSANNKLTEAIDDDIVRYDTTKFADRVRGFLKNAKRDSLTPVVQRQLQYDIPHSWWPARLEGDRGEVLQDQWVRIKNKTFAGLETSKGAKAFSPAIIFSPMLVDSGRPLLISNLNLSCIAAEETHAVEIFRLFPNSQKEVSLATAARMSASFPYISPAAEIPTEPVQRVVDAGYYDNDGITTAAAFLQTDEVSLWLSENVARIIVIRLNAFNRVSESVTNCKLPPPAPGTISPAAEFANSVSRSSSWLTGPIQGAWIARDTRARFSNRQTIDGLKATFQNVCHTDECKDGFLQEIELAYDGDASESWHMPTHALCGMRLALGRPGPWEDMGECNAHYTRKIEAEKGSSGNVNVSCNNQHALDWIEQLLAKP